jgi:hypothetical protein
VVLISLDEVAELPSAATSVGAAWLRKQDLSTRTLRALWMEHHAG